MPGGTCFCASMGTGPRAESGFDLALTELVGEEHRFVVEVGSDRGAEVLADLMATPCNTLTTWTLLFVSRTMRLR